MSDGSSEGFCVQMNRMGSRKEAYGTPSTFGCESSLSVVSFSKSLFAVRPLRSVKTAMRPVLSPLRSVKTTMRPVLSPLRSVKSALRPVLSPLCSVNLFIRGGADFESPLFSKSVY